MVGEALTKLFVGEAGLGTAVLAETALIGLDTFVRALAGVAVLLTLALGRIIGTDEATLGFKGEGGRYGEGTLFVTWSLYESFDVTLKTAKFELKSRGTNKANTFRLGASM